MRVELYRKWLLWVENDWDYRLSLETPPNPYTFANKKKACFHGYREDLLNLALSYKRRNRFGVWERFYNIHIDLQRNASAIKLKNYVLTGSNWASFP